MALEKVRKWIPRSLERALRDPFVQIVNEQITNTPRRSYVPLSAAYFYEPIPWDEALRKMPDHLGFFAFLRSQLGSKAPGYQQVVDIANLINDVFIDKRLFVHVIKEGDDKGSFSDSDGFIADDKSMERHRVFNSKRYTGPSVDTNLPIQVRTRTPSSTSGIILKEDHLKQHPLQSLISVAHGIGHAAEIAISKPSSKVVKGTLINNLVPSTEYYATLYAVQASKMLYDMYSKSGMIELAVDNVEIYNTVMFGKPKLD